MLRLSTGASAGVVGVLAAMVILGATVAFVLQNNKINNLRSDLGTVNSDLSNANHRIADTKRALAASGDSQVAELTDRMTRQDRKLGRMYNCLPELQDEVDGLSVETEWQTIYGTAFLTGAYLSNRQHVSRVCQAIVRPAQAGE
jgi:uncharacterized protein HemX